jgi:hypothetical protein
MRRLTMIRTAGPTARATPDLSATGSSRWPVAARGYMLRPTVGGSAMIGSVNIRASPRSAMVISAVVGRARSGSHYAST